MPPSFPTYLQLESMDCGPTCLRIVAEHYGKRCHITNAGVSIPGLSDDAENIPL